jgi:hypothetical protein
MQGHGGFRSKADGNGRVFEIGTTDRRSNACDPASRTAVDDIGHSTILPALSEFDAAGLTCPARCVKSHSIRRDPLFRRPVQSFAGVSLMP